MGNQKQILATYRDIIAMIKLNLTKDIIEANSIGTINLEPIEIQRLTNLTNTFIDQYAANGYELLQKQTTLTKSTKKTKK